MKAMNFFKTTMGVVMAATLFQSCNKDDDKTIVYYFPNALVTVKQASDKTVYLQLDDKTTLYPVNMKSSPFGDKEVRALTNFALINKESKPYDKAVHINWIDSILTKPALPTTGTESTDKEKYGSDAIEIVKDWVTLAEDGYLTLRFRTVWGNTHTTHYINLLTGVNPDNPYEVELRHDAHGDTHGIIGDALVAFNLKDLPDTNGKTVKLKLKWQSFNGAKQAEFDFCSRKTTVTANMGNEQQQFISTIK